MARPTPAMAVALTALVAALGGTAVAQQADLAKKRSKRAKAAKIIKKGTVGQKLLKGNFSDDFLAPDAVKGDRVDESSLGKVPSAAGADVAQAAGTANTATTATTARRLAPPVVAEKSVPIPADGAEGNSVDLLDLDGWNVYGLCYVDAGSPTAYVAAIPETDGLLYSGQLYNGGGVANASTADELGLTYTARPDEPGGKAIVGPLASGPVELFSDDGSPVATLDATVSVRVGGDVCRFSLRRYDG